MVHADKLEPVDGMRVAFRVDASLSIGTGHVMRCLTLAGVMRDEGVGCLFLCREHLGNLNEFIMSQGFDVHTLCDEESDADARATKSRSELGTNRGLHTLRHADWLGTNQPSDACQSLEILRAFDPDWLIVDHYALDAEWETRMGYALPKTRLLVIDDLADRAHKTDVLLDQNLGRAASDYSGLVPNDCCCLIGPRYALLRPEFAEWHEWSLTRRRKGEPVKTVMISLGGVDKDNVTGQVLNALSQVDRLESIKITVVMGVSSPWLEHVRRQAQEISRQIDVVVNVTDMARRMAEADIAIGAAGSTAWERCCLGLPTILLILADNQKAIARALEAQGAAINSGSTSDTEWQTRFLNAFERLLVCPSTNQRIALNAATVTQGKGAKLVASKINKVLL